MDGGAKDIKGESMFWILGLGLNGQTWRQQL